MKKGLFISFEGNDAVGKTSQIKLSEEYLISLGSKKFYRKLDSYSLYRDFGVIGCGKPRYTG